MTSEVIYVEKCPVIPTQTPFPISGDFCTSLNKTHMICYSHNGIPDFNTIFFLGIVAGIIIALLAVMLWYLTRPYDIGV